MQEQIEITRPKIFPQCESCPIVWDIINSWQDLRNSTPTVVSKTGEIVIDCKQIELGVAMEEKTLITITHNNGQSQEVYRNPKQGQHFVSCPHFNGGPPVTEPE